MPPTLSPGRIVLILAGRFAGKKAVLLDISSSGSKTRKFSHCTVVGIDQGPRTVTRRMGPNSVAKKTRIKPFVRVINSNHIMITRYNVDSKHLKTLQDNIAFKKLTHNEKYNLSSVRQAAKTSLESILQSGHEKYLFSKMAF